MDKQARYEKEVEEQRLKKAMAFELAKAYCERNGLSVKKLERQRVQCIYGSAIFSQPSDTVPDGLRNDLDTRSFPTLIIRLDNGQLQIESTVYTKKYLA